MTEQWLKMSDDVFVLRRRRKDEVSPCSSLVGEKRLMSLSSLQVHYCAQKPTRDASSPEPYFLKSQDISPLPIITSIQPSSQFNPSLSMRARPKVRSQQNLQLSWLNVGNQENFPTARKLSLENGENFTISKSNLRKLSTENQENRLIFAIHENNKNWLNGVGLDKRANTLRHSNENKNNRLNVGSQQQIAGILKNESRQNGSVRKKSVQFIDPDESHLSKKTKHYWSLIRVLFMLVLVMCMSGLCVSGVDGGEIDDFTNRKIFIHNRTATGPISSPASPPVSKNVKNSKGKHAKIKGSKNVEKIPVKESTNGGISGSNFFNAHSFNNYFNTAINFLSLASNGGNEREKEGGKKDKKMKKKEEVTTLHPLAVLQTDVGSESDEKFNMSQKGRSVSHLEFEPLYESEHNSNFSQNEVGSRQNLQDDFFDQFEDHWEDPIAEESLHQNRPSIIHPHFNGRNPHYIPPHLLNSQHEHKYWPTKLNSYYLEPESPLRAPGRVGYENTHFDATHFEHSDEIGEEMSEQVISNKVSMIDRVSVFYTEYKFLTWGIIVVVAALAAFGVLFALYVSNPPTEVVTARKKLESLLEDPKIYSFLKGLANSNLSGKNYNGRKRRKKD